MRILADENIPLVKEVFSLAGEVETVPGRSLQKSMLKGIDALLVRSVTDVGEELLSGTPVRFVGTATTGVDHLDRDFLRRAGITFASAPGSNANSVVEYIFTLILHHASELSRPLESFSLGIVGTGTIGGAVADRAARLGMKVLKNDPPLQEAGTPGDWHCLEEILSCDIITLHVPLTRDGLHPTFHLFNKGNLSKLSDRTYFINASRGAVADNLSLLESARSNVPGKISLDVWENEPFIDTRLLSLTKLSTPHIAGYSYDGKIKGTTMLYTALCDYTRSCPDPTILESVVKPLDILIEIPNSGTSPESLLLKAVATAYDIDRDAADLRKLLEITGRDEQGHRFDGLRKGYPVRREFFNYRVRLTTPDAGLAEKFKILGFRMDT